MIISKSTVSTVQEAKKIYWKMNQQKKSKIGSIHIDSSHDKEYNEQSYSSVKPETSKLTP